MLLARKLDPSRTSPLFRRFAVKLRAIFRQLDKEIKELVLKENAFGITTNAEHKYASTQFNLPEFKPQIESLQSMLDPDDVVELETVPHITVRYGLIPDEDTGHLVNDIVRKTGDVYARILGLSLFQSDEQDVLKFDVESAGLHNLNRRLGTLPNEDKFPTYKPHMTVAYLKPGTGKQYVDAANQLTGRTILLTDFVYSDKERNHTPLSLNAFCPTGEGGGQDNSCGGKTRFVVGENKPNRVTYYWTVGERSYEMTAYVYDNREGIDRWKVSFKDDLNRVSTTGEQGTDAIKVMRAAGAALDKFVSEKQPPRFVFTADHLERSRVSLYDSASNLIAKRHGYSLLRMKGAADDPGDESINYLFTRKKAPTKNYSATFEEEFDLTHNVRFSFQSDPDKVKSFESWLRGRLEMVKGMRSKALWEEYIKQGFHNGATRSYDDVVRTKPSPEVREALGAKNQFLFSAKNSTETADKVKLLAQRTYTDLEGVTQKMATRISRTLSDGLMRGLSPKEIADEMSVQVGIGQNDALRIARTEITRANAEGQLLALKRFGATEVGVEAEWTTSFNPCRICESMKGKVVAIEKASGMIPRHANCVLGDTTIVSPDPFRLMRSHYSGCVVDVFFSNGRRLSVTQHHLMLTQRGWVFAKDLDEFDYVVDASFLDWPSVVGPNKDDYKPTIAQVFEAAIELSDESNVMKTLAMPHDFHGDGKFINFEIEVITIDRKLRNRLNAAFLKTSENGAFGFGAIASFETLALNGESSHSTTLSRLSTAADRFMSSLGVDPMLLGRPLAHHETIGLTLNSRLNTVLEKNSVNNSSTEAKLFGNRVDAASAFEEFDECLHGRLVKLDRTVVTHVENLPVYDVETESTVYAANGIITSNCRCAWTPVFRQGKVK